MEWFLSHFCLNFMGPHPFPQMCYHRVLVDTRSCLIDFSDFLIS